MLGRIAVFCIASVLGALPAAGQPKQGVARIGILTTFPSTDPGRVAVLRERLRELGHEEGKTAAFEIRFAGGRYEQLPALAAELVISLATVKTHVRHVLQKLRLRDRVPAVVVAYESGLL